MLTVGLYIAALLAIGTILFVVFALVVGRGEFLPGISPRVTPTTLPADNVKASDVDNLVFPVVARGYRMSDVDWAINRLREQIAIKDQHLAALQYERELLRQRKVAGNETDSSENRRNAFSQALDEHHDE